MSRVCYEFTGGPLDGLATTEEDGDPIRDGMIYEVLVEGRHLYRTNGPVDCPQSTLYLDYIGPDAMPHYDRPDVLVIGW